MSYSAEQIEWIGRTKAMAGAGSASSVSPEAPKAVSEAASPLKVTILQTDARTELVLSNLAAAVKAGSRTMQADDHDYSVQDAMGSINKEFRNAIMVRKDANADILSQANDMIRGSTSFTEAFSNLAGGNHREKIGTEVRKRALGINDKLNQAAKLALSGQWLEARHLLRVVVTEEQQVRKLLGENRENMIDGAQRMQKGLEATRDGSFAAAKTLAAVSGVGLLAEIPMALLPKGMEVINDIQLDKPIDKTKIGVDVVMTVILTKYESTWTKSLKGMTGDLAAKLISNFPAAKLLEQKLGEELFHELELKAQDWIRDQLADAMKGKVKASIKAVAVKVLSGNSSNWKDIVAQFCSVVFSVEFWEHEALQGLQHWVEAQIEAKREELKKKVEELKSINGEKLKDMALDKAKEIAADKLKEQFLDTAHDASDGGKYNNYLRKKAG